MRNQLSQKFDSLLISNKLHWLIICIGITLRLTRYLHNPSLWFDESVLAADVINRSLAGFIHLSPDYLQTGPLGFFILIKLATQAFGNSEYALRLFPLLFGVIALILFYKVSRQYLSPNAVPVALALFAILDPLIWFSSDLKPYSGDVAFTLLIVTLAIYVQSRILNIPRIALFAVVGAIVIWFSHPSVFVMAGVGVCLSLFCFGRREWSRIGGLSVVFLIWGLSFAAFYFSYTRNLIANIDANIGIEKLLKLENYWMPFPPKSLADIKWYIDSFFGTFDYPVGLSLTGVAAIAFLVGCISMFSEKREKFFILISPIILTLSATALHKYSFEGRIILFLVPLILLFIAEGVEKIRDKTKDKSVIIGIIFMATLFLYPFSWATYHVKKPDSPEEIKPVLSYVKDNWQKGDILYIHFYAQYAFEYYSKYHPAPFKFDEDKLIIGIAPREWHTKWRKNRVSGYYRTEETIGQSSSDIFKRYVEDLNQLTGYERVWVLFTISIPRDGIQEEKFFLRYLDSVGERLDSFRRSGSATVYLYDLSEYVSKNGE